VNKPVKSRLGCTSSAFGRDEGDKVGDNEQVFFADIVACDFDGIIFLYPKQQVDQVKRIQADIVDQIQGGWIGVGDVGIRFQLTDNRHNFFG
jgi:hypothetical protein